jgi:molybdopterin converting factor small subunit
MELKHGNTETTPTMKITVQFFSYYKDLTKADQVELDVQSGSSLGDCLEKVYQSHPALRDFKKSTLTAVGVEYQKSDYLLQPGDRVSMFPPVQGG